MPPIDVSGLVDDLGALTTFTRSDPPTINAYGETVAGATTNADELAVIYPSTPKELTRFPDVDRVMATLTVLTKTAKIPGRDTFIDGGDTFEIVATDDYGSLGGVHISLAKRKNV